MGFGVSYSDEGGSSFGRESAQRGADDFWILHGDAPSTGIHGAFVFDPDGNNIEVVYHER